ncbi:site-specific integrase [Shewanella schlegeliana]|uniref:Site-specific integrase n=1 Tax=Shewanella schlegeliana TaxID=190308 RepID=A0ABS1T1S3_9GAMM|nr:site-specific integrase [Shewanella schlegeliana]MBL4914741.1 site-specific integrase [Shewanella schlegeliana]MCL1109927.1 site-specific integrase [Shewanella schlegeliana]GIU25612.1 transposase [Shewanella schlegeliana]
MVKLIHSSSVFKKTNLQIHNNGSYHCLPSEHNIGSLPTLFSQDGIFLCEPNSYFFYLKAIKRAKDLSPSSRALLKYYQFLEDERLEWDHTPPIKRLKPTYLFRSYLLKLVKQDQLAYSTANAYMNHVKNFYLWTMHERYLTINREQEAPFKIEFVQVKSQGMLAHIHPTFTVQASDLRIKVPKDANSKNIRPLSPLSRDSLFLLTRFLPQESEELRLQVLISIDTGMRIEEIATLTLEALDTATAIAESEHRFEILLCPRTTGVQTKFGKTRHVEISAQLLHLLEDYKTSERRLSRVNKLNEKIKQLPLENHWFKQAQIEVLERCKSHESLFISQQGNPASSKSIESRWGEFRAKIINAGATFSHRFHDLRSTYGTYRLNDLLEAKLPVADSMELLMGWMGHNNESTTWKYLKFLKRKEAFKVKFGLLDSIIHEALESYDD